MARNIGRGRRTRIRGGLGRNKPQGSYSVDDGGDMALIEAYNNGTYIPSPTGAHERIRRQCMTDGFPPIFTGVCLPDCSGPFCRYGPGVLIK